MVLLAFSQAAPAAPLARTNAIPPLPIPSKPGNPFCLEPNATTAEVYGPTDIGAALAGDRIQVAENPHGTLTVFRWPSRSYYQQLKYFTTSRDAPLLGANPNEGAFTGLALRLRNGSKRFVWLRDLPSSQRYASNTSDTVITSYVSRPLRFSIAVEDVVPPSGDVLLRMHVLRLARGSAVRSAALVSFENFNPVASRWPLLPVRDWCAQVQGTDLASYDRRSDSIVYSRSDYDLAAQRPASVAVATGASAPSIGHQVGADTYTSYPGTSSGPQDAYDDAEQHDGQLAGDNQFGPSEVDSALAYRITPGRPLTLIFAAAADPGHATALVDAFRKGRPLASVRAKQRWYARWLRDAPLPRGAPRAVLRLAERALVTLRVDLDDHAGRDGRQVGIVASISTQSPYYEDWIRDGSFLNEALDLIGHPDLVARHNAFYASVQHTAAQGAPPGSPLSACQQPTPDGNWFMTNWADGPDAGIYTWEIDETALGVWTLWRHFGRLAGHPQRERWLPYLRSVYPAIQRAANFLIAYRDPATGLPPGTACEDDNLPHQGQPSMHSAGPEVLALRSAAATARALGQHADAVRYQASADTLLATLERDYDVGGGAFTTDYGDGGWVLWPEQLLPYSNPRMRAQAEAVWSGIAPTFLAPHGPRTSGSYEAKGLLGLAYWARSVHDNAMLARVKAGLRWIAGVEVRWQGTGIMGESWYVRNGEVISVPAQPHAWEQVLFYLAALEAYGSGTPSRKP